MVSRPGDPIEIVQLERNEKMVPENCTLTERHEIEDGDTDRANDRGRS